MSDFDWWAYLVTQLWAIPSLFVYFIGATLALVRWHRHPAVSALCLVAFAIFFFNFLIGAGYQLWEMRAIQRGDFVGSLRFVLVFRIGLGTVAWVSLLTAMFGWRSIPVDGKRNR